MLSLFPRMPGPGLAPLLVEGELGDMAEAFEAEACRSRRRHALARKDVLRENFVDLIDKLIDARYRDRLLQRRMKRWAPDGVLLNAMKDITRQLACVYVMGARRLLNGATDDVDEAWGRVLTDIHADSIRWNRDAFGLGPVGIVPVCRDGVLKREFWLPHQTEVMTAPEDPTGPITAAMREVYSGTNQGEWDDKRVRWVYVDREKWVYLNYKGQRVRGPNGHEVEEHGLKDERGKPMCPYVEVRLDKPDDDDRWSSTANERLFVGSLLLSLVYVRMQFVLKTQDSKIPYYKGPDGLLVEGELLDPELPIILEGQEAAAALLDYLDLATDPEFFHKRIRFGYRMLANGYGVPVDTVVDFSDGGPVATVKARNQHKAQLREEQIPHLRPSERQIAVVSTAQMRRHLSMNKDFRKIPPVAEVAESFSIEFPKLPTIDDPVEQRAQDDWEMALGITSPVDIAERSMPDLTRKERYHRLKNNVKEKAKFDKIYRDAQAPKNGPPAAPDGAPGQPISSRLGEQGGRPPEGEKPNDNQGSSPDGAGPNSKPG